MTIVSTPKRGTNGAVKNQKKSGNGQSTANNKLYTEIVTAIQNVGGYGSIEVYIQDHHVTQITTRKIRKTKQSVRTVSV